MRPTMNEWIVDPDPTTLRIGMECEAMPGWHSIYQPATLLGRVPDGRDCPWIVRMEGYESVWSWAAHIRIKKPIRYGPVSTAGAGKIKKREMSGLFEKHDPGILWDLARDLEEQGNRIAPLNLDRISKDIEKYLSTPDPGEDVTLVLKCSRCGAELSSVYTYVNGVLLCSRCVQGNNNNYPQSPAVGWICPACGRGNSPYAAQCDCGPRYNIKIGGRSDD